MNFDWISVSMRKFWPGLLLFSLVAGAACVPQPQAAPLTNFMARAEPLIAERRYTEAAILLDEAARTRPEDPVPLLRLGQIYLVQHRWLLAEDAFNRALARNPHQPRAVAGLAEAFYNQARLNEALKLWQEVTVLNPKLAGAFTGLGRTHLALFDFRAAREAFMEQQRRQPDPEAQWYLAALAAPSNVSAALDYLEALPQSENGEMSESLTARRDYLLATLEPFTTASPQATVAKATGVALAQAQLWPLAVHALTIAKDQQHPDDAETLAFLGYALAQAGRPALDLFEQARQADPASALPLYFQGIYLRQQGALKAAEALFKQAVTLDPENAAFYAEMAETKAQQGDLGTAEVWYQAALQVAEDDVQFQLLQAQFYAKWGYHMAEAGIPAAEKIIEANPTLAEAYDLLGWMQFLSGGPEGGEAALRRALELDPDLTSARYHLARQLEVNGQIAEAVEAYQRVIDWDTSGVFRDRALKDLQRLKR